MTAVKNAHVVISGFSQRCDEPTGCHKVWMELGRLRSPNTLVMLCEWNANWSKVAEMIFLGSRNGGNWDEDVPRVNIYAYSWGAGYGFVQLARQLADRGIAVQKAVLCDPVYHGSLLSRILVWLPWCKIVVPTNVRDVFGLRQNTRGLRGHHVVPRDDRRTKVHPFKLRERSHTYMDDDPEFMKLCCRAAGLIRGEACQC